MGQQQTRGKSSFLSNSDNQIYDERLDYIKSLDGLNEDRDGRGFCNVMLCKPDPRKRDQQWKVFLIKRLESMKADEWSQPLLKVLLGSDKNTLDAIYQTDVLWACYKDKKKKNDKKKIALRATEIELKDHRQTNYTEESPIKRKEEEESSPEKPLQIPDDESFYNHNHEGKKWMKSSFNLQPKEDREAVINSIEYLKDIQDSVGDLESVNNNPDRMSLHDKLSTIYQIPYDNYTVLSPNSADAPVNQYEKDSYRVNINKYKALLNLIQKHLCTETHIFRRLINQFEICYVEHYGKFLDQYHNGNLKSSDLKKITNKATTDLQQFISLLFEAMIMYYKLDKIKKNSQNSYKILLNRDNLLSFVTSVIFSEGIYNTIFQLFCTQDTEIEALYQKNIARYINFNPEDFGVADEYCLNEKTIEYFKAKGVLKKEEYPQNSRENVDFEETEFEKTVDEYQQRRTINKLSIEKDIEQPIFSSVQRNRPYNKAILLLSDLERRRSPLHKLKNIVKAAELISKYIHRFYKKHGIPNQNRLDADQTLTLFLYLVAKSGLTNVTAHYKIIEKFTTNNILNSASGYYATTLGASVAYICSMKSHKGSEIRQSRGESQKFINSVNDQSSITFSTKVYS